MLWSSIVSLRRPGRFWSGQSASTSASPLPQKARQHRIELIGRLDMRTVPRILGHMKRRAGYFGSQLCAEPWFAQTVLLPGDEEHLPRYG
jgi:hypothetical protein